MSTGQIQCPQCEHIQPDEWQFCQSCLYNLHYTSVNTTLPQIWVELQKKLMDPARMDPQSEIKAQDTIEAAKKHELKTNTKAASWERGRRAEWKANKPYYLKQHKNGG